MFSMGTLQSHFLHERLKAWVTAQRIDNRMHVEISHPAASLFVRTLDPVERALIVAESDVHRRELDRGDVVVVGLFFQLYRKTLRVLTLAGARQRVSQRDLSVRPR